VSNADGRGPSERRADTRRTAGWARSRFHESVHDVSLIGVSGSTAISTRSASTTKNGNTAHSANVLPRANTWTDLASLTTARGSIVAMRRKPTAGSTPFREIRPRAGLPLAGVGGVFDPASSGPAGSRAAHRPPSRPPRGRTPDGRIFVRGGLALLARWSIQTVFVSIRPGDRPLAPATSMRGTQELLRRGARADGRIYVYGATTSRTSSPRITTGESSIRTDAWEILPATPEGHDSTAGASLPPTNVGVLQRYILPAVDRGPRVSRAGSPTRPCRDRRPRPRDRGREVVDWFCRAVDVNPNVGP